MEKHQEGGCVFEGFFWNAVKKKETKFFHNCNNKGIYDISICIKNTAVNELKLLIVSNHLYLL